MVTVVATTGDGVTDVRPGQRVMGLFTGGTGPVAVADRRLLTTIPDAWTFAQATIAFYSPIAALGYQVAEYFQASAQQAIARRNALQAAAAAGER